MLLSRRLRLSILLLAISCALPYGCAASISSHSFDGLSIPTTTPAGATEGIPAKLLKPEGSGPFPAVVVMHDCGGVGPRSSGAPERWGKELVAWGYVVLIPDSFSTRGFPRGVCTDLSPGRSEVGPPRRVSDAYAALAYLRTLPYVNRNSVGIMGGSHGGATTLATMAAAETSRDLFAHEKRAGTFAAAVALYPGCGGRLGSWRATRSGETGPITDYSGIYQPIAPVLILVGEKDDWTPAEPCRKLTEISRQAAYPVTLKVYPGAHHSFDSDRPVNFNDARFNLYSPTGHGATTGGNADAWGDSIREVEAFFRQYLRHAVK